MKYYSIEFWRASDPCAHCYPRDKMAALLPDPFSAADIVGLPDTPADYRLRGLIALLPDRARRLLACEFAERALFREREAGREPDSRSWAAVDVARRMAHGLATEAEQILALYAAWAAKRHLQGAKFAAAWAAERSAADDSRLAAAWAAEQSAVQSGEPAAEKKWQILRAAFLAGREVQP